jgi:2-polyprenyl-3-methyl-5-hydroxy-6-metoxy-1,4-benzoquinol methylase
MPSRYPVWRLISPLGRRRRQAEIMDEPGLDTVRHRQALKGLARINKLSGSCRIVRGPVFDLARSCYPRQLRVLDIASGAGDIPIQLWLQGREDGLNLHFEGCDRSQQAVEYASEEARRLGAEVRFFLFDALNQSIPDGFDVILCSLFLHHLDEDETAGLLRRLVRAAARMVIINDLVRSLRGLLLAYAGTRILSSSSVVHADGPRSVLAAYKLSEIRSLLREDEMGHITIEKRWPCRFLLVWRRP